MTIRIAMWSGPRNISTAMMRAWENRPDCVVVDEPFYAYYLNATGIDHPVAAEVIASQPTDWRVVATELSEGPCAADVFYQKHMTHHMLAEVDLNWTSNLLHCFLIRDPKYVVNSYIKKRETVTAEDIGLQRQLELYEEISDISGQTIPVIDASKFLQNPAAMLKLLCERFEIPFYNEMLQWPAGRRDSDGIWASHWYQKVETTTSFESFSDAVIDLEDEHLQVVLESEPYYQRLSEKSLHVN